MSDNKLMHERLRDAVENDERWGQCTLCETVLKTPCSKVESCTDWMMSLADEIEREYIPRKEADAEKRQIIEAQKDSAHHIMRLYAESIGKPMEDGENITKWLDKWFIPRPRFEDGEPVQFGCNDIAWNNPDGQSIDGHWAFTAINRKGYPMANGLSGIIAYAEMTDDGFVKRRIDSVLDADGVPIKVGETVWSTMYSQMPIKVTRIGIDPINGKDMGVFDEDGVWCRCGIVTHREPDSVNRLLDDMKSYSSEHFMPDSDTKKAINGWIERIAEMKMSETA